MSRAAIESCQRKQHVCISSDDFDSSSVLVSFGTEMQEWWVADGGMQRSSCLWDLVCLHLTSLSV